MNGLNRIRVLKDSDRDAFLKLYQGAFPEKDITLKTWARIATEPATVWLLEDGGAPVAFLYFWAVADEFQIIDIGTAPDRRRESFAKTLLNGLIAHADAEKKRVVLEVRVGNSPAIALYEACGFERSGVRERYYGNGDDALMYSYAPR